MQELNWNQYEFIECLGTVPRHDEFFNSFTFSNVFEGLSLELTVWPSERSIAISIANDTIADSFLSLLFVVGNQVTFIKDEKFMGLRFRGSVAVPSNFWQYEKDEQELFISVAEKMKTDFELSTFPRLAFRVL
jgi:hypothetical protein